MPTCREAQEGTWEFGDWSRRYARRGVHVGRRRPVLHPIAAPNAVPGLDGVGTAGLVDGGTGSFFDPARVSGKVVLVKVSVNGISPAMLTRAPRPVQGAARLRSGSRKVAARDRLHAAQRGHLLLPMAEGDQAQALLAAAPGGQPTLSWKATASSPYVYNLGFTQSTPLTDDKTFVVQDKKLGRTEADYKGMGVDTPLLDYVYAGRDNGVAFGVSAYEAVQVATKRTEFYTDGGTKWVPLPHLELPLRRGDGRRLAHLSCRQCPH